jgi:subtilisin family serine protease
MKSAVISLVFVVMLVSRSEAPAAQAPAAGKIDPAVIAAIGGLQPGGRITVIVKLKDRVDLSVFFGKIKNERLRNVIQALRARAGLSQVFINALLRVRQVQGKVARFVPLWVLNAVSVTAVPDVLYELAALPEVASIDPDAIDAVPNSAPPAGLPEANVAAINAPALWALGYSGQGVVVANLDSGVDVSHPDLMARWRGGTNSWYDPYNQHPNTPVDLTGHGTWTMGVMVGGDASGPSIGVAPGAQWVAARIFNDKGQATATAIHQAFQWLLDPDGNPDTADAPDVVNNSWSFGGPGCNLEFQSDLQALRAAGILPVFAAGNYGPGPSTSTSPSNYAEAFAVGATDNNYQIYAYSSRGPSACGEPSGIYPELVAPAVNVGTTDLYGFYYQASGTSMSAPHAAGALALLLSAFPDLSAEEQSAALLGSAADLGVAGPDNDFGHGSVDAYAAFNCIQAGTCTPPPPQPLTLECASAAGQLGSPYTSSLSAAGGTAPYGFTITAGGLPPGLTLNSSTGTITGTPTATGTYAYTAMVTDSGSGTPQTATVGCSITITPRPLTLDCASGTAQAGAAYSSSLTATGGVPPYSYTITAGSLPPGLALDPSTGAVTGIPTTSGSHDYTAVVTDSAAGSATVSCSIAVAPPPLTLGCASGSGQVGGSYSSALTATGGTAPYAFSIAAGNLPPGLILTSATGAIAGTPTASGTYAYTARVTDSTGGAPLTATANCSVSIAPPPTPTVHVGDIDAATSKTRSAWTARITLTAHSGDHTPLSGVKVTGNWSGGYSRTASCTTGSTGSCQISTGSISKNAAGVTFTVTAATRSSYVYQSAGNHDPDGDSTGTVITVARP